MVPRAAPPGPITRIGNAIAGAVIRLLGVGLKVGSGSGSGVPASPHYDVDATNRAMASNAWYWAAVHRIANDLAGLPLVAETGTGNARVQSSDHWLISLLEQPHPKVSGRRFRRQLVADLKGGNSYTRVWRNPEGRPIQLGRVVPSLIKPLVVDDGEVVGFELQGGRRLAWREVLHITDISIDSDVGLVFGASPTQPLALGLQVERDARRQAGRAAKRGRTEMILSPRSESMVLGEERSKAMAASYGQATEEGHGVFIPSVGMDATPVTLTAREMEFSELSDRTRAEVLTVLGVPESMVGTPAANYGTAREQSRIYWSMLQGLAALIDDELSRLAEDGVRIRHSFAGVDALQPSRTEQQARAVVWIDKFGLSPDVAARYEGFHDLPAPAAKPAASSAPAAAPPSASGVQEPRKSTESAVVATLQVLAGLYEAAGEDPDRISFVARSLLRSTLQGLGAGDDSAELVATEAAEICAETARSCPDNLVELKAFGRDHAHRITRLAGLEEAA